MKYELMDNEHGVQLTDLSLRALIMEFESADDNAVRAFTVMSIGESIELHNCIVVRTA